MRLHNNVYNNSLNQKGSDVKLGQVVTKKSEKKIKITCF